MLANLAAGPRLEDELIQLPDLAEQPVDFPHALAIVHDASNPANAAFNRASLANA